ncbi:MAG: EF-P lysine aminoacylase EpmA [Acidiferrobacteraceae bacterium]
MSSPEWRPSTCLDVLRLRAQLLRRAREYFEATGVLEVETPALSSAGATDPHLCSFTTTGMGGVRYLHTSPEFPMKRLLAAGSGSIYQICHVFRDGESGRLHNPEFTLIEWYRVGYDHWALIADAEALLRTLLGNRCPAAAAERLSYGEAFQRYTGIDPHAATVAQLARCARAHGIGYRDDGANIDTWRDLLMTHLVEPCLGRVTLTFLYGYPASQAALARIDPGPPPVARRFEVYLEGLELGNGFHELADTTEWQRRVDRDLTERCARALPEIPVDNRLRAALDHGLPDCAGIAIGFDRVLMLAAGRSHLGEVLAFPETLA